MSGQSGESKEQSPAGKDVSSGKGRATQRIETQIHRRKKAKAVYPLEAEWQMEQREAPSLRMSAGRMNSKPKPK